MANSYFKNNLKRLLDNSLKEYESNMAERLSRLQEQLDQGDLTDEEFRSLKA